MTLIISFAIINLVKVMEKKDYIITLDDNKEYALVNSIEYEGCKYVYLIELNNYENVLFGEISDDTITIVDDPEFRSKLIAEFAKLEEK